MFKFDSIYCAQVIMDNCSVCDAQFKECMGLLSSLHDVQQEAEDIIQELDRTLDQTTTESDYTSYEFKSVPKPGFKIGQCLYSILCIYKLGWVYVSKSWG